MREEFSQILESLLSSWTLISAWLPRLLVATILLLLGWLLARAVRRVVVKFLRWARLEAAAEQTGVDDFLARGGVRFTIVTLVGEIVYWGLILIFTVAALNLLGINVGQELTDRLAQYVPNLVAAMVVLVFGTVGARFIRGLVEAYLENLRVTGAAGIAVLVQGALLAFVAVLALEQLGLAMTLLTSAFLLVLGGLCLALALAFGLGGRAWAESILERSRSKR